MKKLPDFNLSKLSVSLIIYVPAANKRERYMKLARSVIYGILTIVISGCGPPTTLQIKNVSREKVAQILWEHGSKRKYNSLLGPASERVWSSAEDINREETTIEYQIDSFLMKTYGKDSISILGESPNEIEVSLQCEDKDVIFNFCWGLLSFYTRDLTTERNIMFRAATQLKNQAGASIEWVGYWQPANLPKIVMDGNAIWVAYKGASAEVASDYLTRWRYQKSACSNEQRTVFERDLRDHPDDGLGSLFAFAIFLIMEQWESREKIVIRTITPENNPDSHEGVVVIGAAAFGIEHVNTVLSWTTKNKDRTDFYTDVGKELKEKVIYEICSRAAISAKGVTFVDPSPWIEVIELSPLETDFAKEGIKEMKLKQRKRKQP